MLEEKVYRKVADCSICLIEMSSDIGASKKCGHLFHKSCLLRSLESRNFCPNCRIALTSNDILDIVYDLDDIKENKDFQSQYKVDMNKLKELEKNVDLLKKGNTELRTQLKSKDKDLSDYQEKFKDVPNNLLRLKSFPEMKEKVAHQYKKLQSNLPDLSKHAPDDNLNNPFVGPLYYEDSKSVYFGQYWRQKRHGHGKMMWSDGNYYEGTWKNDCMEGFGLLIKSTGTYVIGHWNENKIHGEAEYFSKNGDKYSGQWSKGQKHGQGKEMVRLGSTYEGEFKDGRKIGKGKVTFHKGNVYEGDIVDGSLEGHGKMVWPDGKTYEGSWVKDKMDGHGKFDWKNQQSYIGGYLKGEKNGRGELRYPDGKMYVGGFKNGTQHGQGRAVYPDGTVKDGDWVDGEFQESIVRQG